MNEILKAKIRSALETGWQFLPDLSNGTVSMVLDRNEPVVLLQIVAPNWATADFTTALADFINSAAEPVEEEAVEASEEE
jgi:hypothetical protein